MNIYFICTGNTCRSPMAEAILRARKIDEIEVRSAGIHAIEGIPIAEYAERLIKEGNMPYTATSNIVTKEDVKWADYIFTMTDRHKQVLQMMYPDETRKIYTLKGFLADGNDGDVQDPFGGNLDTYRKTFDELVELMEVLERKLARGT